MTNFLSRLRSWIGITPAAPTAPATPSGMVIDQPPRAPRFGGPLLGLVTRNDLEHLPGWSPLPGAAYTPASEAIATLAAHAADVEVSVFLGTWCGDTRRELPRFFAILDAAGWDASHISYIGLDYTKRDPEGRTAALQIHAVPTFVLFCHGQELGRIVERPRRTLESDLAQIVSAAQPADCGSIA